MHSRKHDDGAPARENHPNNIVCVNLDFTTVQEATDKSLYLFVLPPFQQHQQKLSLAANTMGTDTDRDTDTV